MEMKDVIQAIFQYGDTVCKVRGKNLWNNELENAEYDENGNKIATLIWLVNQVPINVKPNTQYTISQVEKPSQYRIICFKDYNYLSRINNTQDTSSGYVSYTFTTPANCNKIFIQFRSTLEVIATGRYDMSTTSITEVQLEEGTKTDYEPYQEKTITFPFGEQKFAKGDYLASDGIHRVGKQIVFNGTENWQSFTDLGSTVRAFYTYDGVKKDGNIFCNKFTTTTNFELDEEGIGVTPYTSSLFYIKINKSRLSSENLQGFKTFLSECEPVIEYESETEEIIPYTQAQQTAYNNLQNLILFEGYNHMEMISPNGVKANLTVDYTKSTQMVINDIEERLSALEYAGLEG